MHRGRHLLDFPSGSRALLQADLNVTVALVLLIASGLLGLATSLFFQVWALVPLSMLIAILAAISLQAHGFGFAGGVSITIGCLVISQIAYIAAGLVMFGSYRPKNLTQDEVDGDPDGRGEHDVPYEDE
jgi:uncharacterized membrane protein YkgB